MLRLASRVWCVPVLVLWTACGSGEDGDASAMPAPEASPQDAAAAQLSAQEVSDGWRMLFDGSLDGWRGYRRESVPGGWGVEDGVLVFSPGVEGGDLMTVDQFGNFELVLEWRIEEGGNSGVFFRVTETEEYPFWTGPEMQILDNANHRDGQNPTTSAGAAYGIYAPVEDATRPLGEWNEARILVEGNQVTHWLNGTELLSYELQSDEWEALVQETKFVDWPNFGREPRGHIVFQDHGDPVWFRNVKIREIHP